MSIGCNPHAVPGPLIGWLAMLPRVVGEVDLAIINTTFALEATLSPSKDALIVESGESNCVNLLAARSDNKDSPAMKKLAAALQSAESRKFILERFQGNLVPAFWALSTNNDSYPLDER